MSKANSLESISIVLVKTSHPGNVGSVARAMKTMGLYDLRLVCPKYADIHQHDEAIALASGATDVLQRVKVFNALPDALHDAVCAYALSARIRELGPVLMSPEQAAQDSELALAQPGAGVAFVLGAERTGLTNDELLACNRQVYIPSNPVYNSLNLSQAAQIVCYALRRHFTQEVSTSIPATRDVQIDTNRQSNPATVQAVEQLKAHWLLAMEKVDFLNPDKPRKLVQRLGKLLGRAQLEQEEVDMLRGFLSDVIRVSEGRLYPHERTATKPDGSA